MKALRMAPWLLLVVILQSVIASTALAGGPEPPPQPGWLPTPLTVSASSDFDAMSGSSGFEALSHTAGCPESPTSSFAVSDPEGDAFPFLGIGPVVHDITNVSGEADDETFCLTVEFADPILPPDPSTGEGVIAVIEFDLDEDPLTGISNVADAFCPEPAGIGVDGFLTLSDASGIAEFVYTDFSRSPALVPVTFDGMSFTAVFPLSVLDGDTAFNFATIAGTFEEPTDCAPNGGSVHSPDGSIVPPAPPPPPLELELTIDPVGSVVPSQGIVTISGTVTCSSPAEVEIFGDGTQRAGRVLIQGFFFAFVSCHGETPWSATFSGENGIYKGGRLDVTASAFGFTDTQFGEDFAEETVRLKGKGANKGGKR